MDKQLFIANLATVRRRKILLIRVVLSILFVLLVASMWLNKTHPHDRIHATFKTASSAGFLIVVFLAMTSMQRLTRRLGLHCPHCNRSLSGPLSHRAVTEETCFHCGRPLF